MICECKCCTVLLLWLLYIVSDKLYSNSVLSVCISVFVSFPRLFPNVTLAYDRHILKLTYQEAASDSILLRVGMAVEQSIHWQFSRS